MNGNPTKSLNSRLSLNWLIVHVSLALTLLACQTTAPKDSEADRQNATLESQRGIVRAALDAGKPESALQSLRDLLREHPDDASINNLMGLTQLALKNPQRAVTHFRRAYKLDPQPAAGLNLSSAYIESGDSQKAIVLLKSMLAAKGKKGYQFKERVYHNLGYAYLRQNQLTKAQSWFQEALDENPSFFPSQLEMAKIYEKTNRPAMAMKTYRQAIDHCHICFEPVQSLSVLYSRAGRFADARKLLLSYSKVDGVATPDRVAAERLLKLVTTAGLPRSAAKAPVVR